MKNEHYTQTLRGFLVRTVAKQFRGKKDRHRQLGYTGNGPRQKSA